MKILLVSVFSNHFINWASQLRNSPYEIYWLDIHDNNAYINRLDFIHQIINWKRRFDFPGREWIKMNFPIAYKFIDKFNSRKFEKEFKRQLEIINPDVVQSFEMHSGCVPILKIMNKKPDLKWIYSSMGNDIYYFQKFPDKLISIQKTLRRINYMFADCHREYTLAYKNGFRGELLGVFPTGGGYDLKFCDSLIQNKERKSIIIKGYQSKFGRCLSILKALSMITDEVKDLRIIIFSRSNEVEKYIEDSGLDKMLNLDFKGSLGRVEVLRLMGQSLIYIGNSISDGMPNTLLEAMIMGAFPIQSNPGGATEEIIVHNRNGFLIQNPEDSYEIAMLIKQAVKEKELIKDAVDFNTTFIKPKLDRSIIQKLVLEKYSQIV